MVNKETVMRTPSRLRQGRTIVAVALATTAVGVGGLAASAGLPGSGPVTSSDAEVFVSVAPVRVTDTREPVRDPFGPGETRTLSFAGYVHESATAVAVT